MITSCRTVVWWSFEAFSMLLHESGCNWKASSLLLNKFIKHFNSCLVGGWLDITLFFSLVKIQSCQLLLYFCLVLKFYVLLSKFFYCSLNSKSSSGRQLLFLCIFNLKVVTDVSKFCLVFFRWSIVCKIATVITFLL